MKLVLTGSTGHITKPLAQKLIAAGHEVSIISSSADKVKEIESLGAKAEIGSVEDKTFLTKAFAGADAVYLMIPPKWTVTNWIEYQAAVGENFAAAVKANSIPNVVVLSSIGAHMKKGAGPVDGVALLEDQLSKISGLNAKFLRPTYFYYNLFSMIPLIKNAGIIGSTQPADYKMGLTHTDDIAQAAFEELSSLSFKGISVRYIASDQKTWTEITEVLGAAIGKPELPYVEFTDEQSLGGMLQAGLSQTIAEGYAAMGKALREGTMDADFRKNPPAEFGKVKLSDFAKEFAEAYKKS